MFTKDLLYAARSLAKSPVFLVTAVLTIALGIGASTAIFSVTNAVLLRPLPYKDPERLIIACGDMRKRNVKDFPFSNAEYFDLRETDKNTFEDFAGVFTARGPVLRADGTPEQVRFGVVTPNFFRLAGRSHPYRPRFLRGGRTGTAPAAATWKQRAECSQRSSAASSSPPSRSSAMNTGSGDLGAIRPSWDSPSRPPAAVPAPQIVGVLAPRFELLFPPDAALERVPDIWIANRLAYDGANRNNVSLRIVGRLKPGVTLDRAQIAADAYSRHEQSLDKILITADWHVRLVPMQQHLVAEVRPAILALMGAVIFLLLIACSNVANLLLVRASLRERELAVRTALGGSRWRLVRQMLAEALLLSSVGTVLGLALAWIGIHELLVIAPANLPRLDAIQIDPVVVAFTALAGLAAAAIFGVVPALRASRPDVMHVLRSSGRTAGLGGGRLLRNGVVIAEVALSFVLLIGSGLMFRSFLELQRINPGFDSHRLLTFQLLGGRGGRTPEQRAAFQRETRQALSSVGGVDECQCGISVSACRRIQSHSMGPGARSGRPQQVSGGRSADRAAGLFRNHAHAIIGWPHFYRGR